MSYADGMGEAIINGFILAFVAGIAFSGLAWALWHFVLSHITIGWV
jgi:hypothetical protein